MCDYCDCRSQPEIAELSAEHDAVLSLVGRLRTAARLGDLDAVAAVRRQLAEVLGPHTAREERGLFRQLRRSAAGDWYVDGLVDDHEVIDVLLTGSVSVDRAHCLGDLLVEHVLREETDVFPAARQLLSPDQWEAVAVDTGRAEPAAATR